MLLNCIFLVVLFGTNHSKPKAKQVKYGMVIDAGSTHSQLFIYRFSCDFNELNPKSTPMQIAFSESTEPITALQSQEQCDNLLSFLIIFAKTYLEDFENEWNQYPIYLKATAGMRLLGNPKKQNILEWIQTSFLNRELNPFLYDDELNQIIISGKQESMFGWLAVNLLYNKLQNISRDPTYVSYRFFADTLGILDLGGQSAQIAFMANYGLYTNSLLGYGTIGTEQNIADFVYKHKDYYINDVAYNPCLNSGYNEAYNGRKNINIQFGSSSNDSSRCCELIRNVFSLDLSVDIAQTVPSNMKFVASQGFGYGYDDLDRPKNMDLRLLYDMMLDICGMTIEQLTQSKWNKNNDVDEKYLNKLCLLSNYIYVLLHDIYGFDLKNKNIEWTNEHNGKVISWTQGFMLTHLNDNVDKYCLYDYNAMNMVNINIYKRDNDNFHGYIHNASNEQLLYFIFIIAFLLVAGLYEMTVCVFFSV